MTAKQIEFLCWYSDPEERLVLPESLKMALKDNIPQSIWMTVGFKEYQFAVKSDEEGEWLINGKVWEEYVIHRHVQPDSLLHVIVIEDGPIYLIHYNNFGVSMIHPKKTPRAMAKRPNHSPEYVEIHKQWFELIDYEKQETNQMLIQDNAYEVQIYYKQGMPNGFYGAGWTQLYADLHITNDDAIVFVEISPNVFTLSVFDQWEGHRKSTPNTSAILLKHNNIIYDEELEMVMFEHPKEATFGIGTSPANGITEFDKEMDDNLLKKTLPDNTQSSCSRIPANEV